MIDLFPFQDTGAAWLASMKIAILADEMRLGKSAQAIRACDLIFADRVLVICPATAKENWAREFETFSITGINPEILSYDGLVRASYASIFASPWDVLICDESHYLKEPKSKRTQAVFGSAGVARISKRVWLLSGTPAPNHAAELWVILHVAGRTALAYESFIDQYCVSYILNNRRQITGTNVGQMSQVRAMLRPILLRR